MKIEDKINKVFEMVNDLTPSERVRLMNYLAGFDECELSSVDYDGISFILKEEE